MQFLTHMAWGAELLVQLAEASAALAKKLGLPPQVQQAAAAAIAIAAADLGSAISPVRPQQRRSAPLPDRRGSASDATNAAATDGNEPGAEAGTEKRSTRLQRKRARTLSDCQTAFGTGAARKLGAPSTRSTRNSGALDTVGDASDRGALASDTMLSDVVDASTQPVKLAPTKRPRPRTKCGASGKARGKPRGKGKKGRRKKELSSSLGSLSDSSSDVLSDNEFQPQRRCRLSDIMGLASEGSRPAVSTLDTTASSGGATAASADVAKQFESDSCQIAKEKLSDTKTAKASPANKGPPGQGRILVALQTSRRTTATVCDPAANTQPPTKKQPLTYQASSGGVDDGVSRLTDEGQPHSQSAKPEAVQTPPAKSESGRATTVRPETKCTKVGYSSRQQAPEKLPGTLEEVDDGIVTAFRIPKRAPKPLSKEDLKRIAFARARSEAAARAAARVAAEKRASDAAAASRAAKLAERRAESAQTVLGSCLHTVTALHII